MKSSLFSPRRAGSKLALSATGALVLLAVAACSGGGETPEPSTDDGGSTWGIELPDYYPENYSDIIEASKAEGGELVIQSNTSQENWAPIFAAFQEKYDWAEKVSANNLDSDEVFQRTLSEQATGNVTVDLAVSNATGAWAEFAETDGALMAYESPEAAELPDYAELLPNVYAMSTDPMLLIYNTALMDEAPTGIAHLAEMVAADPDRFTDKIEIRDPESSFGFTINYNFIEATEGAWDSYEAILPVSRPETSSGTMTEKLISGEYVAGFLISGSSFPAVEGSGGLVEAVYPDDGTVVLPRGIGIVEGAPHPATAKLLLDFVMSQEGQQAVAEGGLASYREGVEAGEGIHTYQEIADIVGEDNIVFVPYEVYPEDVINEFLDRFYGYMGQ